MPLDVIVIGAGLAGFGAAIALGQQGHNVQIFEKSSFSKETGAAIALAPQVVRILRHWGIDENEMRPTIGLRSLMFDAMKPGLPLVRTVFEYQPRAQELGITEPEILVHRVDAHTVLRQHALSLPNVHLSLSSPVRHVDAHSGTVTLENGMTHTADLVIGADGVHSKAVEAIEGGSLPISRLDLDCFRFLVSTDLALKNPDIASVLRSYDYEHSRASFVDVGPPRRTLFFFPCREGTLLSCIMGHPPQDESAVRPEDGWNTTMTPEDICKQLHGFPDAFYSLVRLAQETTHWAFFDRACPSTFKKDRLVVIGDAAHPMLPHLGAGGATGLEDAATLGALIDRDTEAEHLGSRLDIFNRLRYERGVCIKIASDSFLKFTPEAKAPYLATLEKLVPGAVLPSDHIKYLWDIDVVKVAREALLASQDE